MTRGKKFQFQKLFDDYWPLQRFESLRRMSGNNLEYSRAVRHQNQMAFIPRERKEITCKTDEKPKRMCNTDLAAILQQHKNL